MKLFKLVYFWKASSKLIDMKCYKLSVDDHYFEGVQRLAWASSVFGT